MVARKIVAFWAFGISLSAGIEGAGNEKVSSKWRPLGTSRGMAVTTSGEGGPSRPLVKATTAMRPVLRTGTSLSKKVLVQPIGQATRPSAKKFSAKKNVVSAKRSPKRAPARLQESTKLVQPLQPVQNRPEKPFEEPPAVQQESGNQLPLPPSPKETVPTGTLRDTYAAPLAPALPTPQLTPLETEAQRLVFDLGNLYEVNLAPEQETAITAVYFLVSSQIGSPALADTLDANRCKAIADLLEHFLNPALAVNAPLPLVTQFHEFLRNNPNCRLVPQAHNAVVFLTQTLSSQDPVVQAAAKQVLRAYIQLCLDLIQRKCQGNLLTQLNTVQQMVLTVLRGPLSEAQKQTLNEEGRILKKVYDGAPVLDPHRVDAIIRTILEEILGAELTQQQIVREVFWAFNLIASTLGARDEKLRLASFALLRTIRNELNSFAS